MPEGGIPIYVLFRTYPRILVCTDCADHENNISEGFGREDGMTDYIQGIGGSSGGKYP